MAAFIYRNKKTYPCAIDGRKLPLIKAGTAFEALAYRQYFDPEYDREATAVYFHPEAGRILVYLHFHKNMKAHLVKLPAIFSDKKISVVEKSPACEILTKGKITDGGIMVSIADNHGFAVIQLD